MEGRLLEWLMGVREEYDDDMNEMLGGNECGGMDITKLTSTSSRRERVEMMFKMKISDQGCKLTYKQTRRRRSQLSQKEGGRVRMEGSQNILWISETENQIHFKDG